MTSDWQPVTSLPPLGAGELQLWRLDLDATAPVDACLRLLSPEELARADRLRAGQVRMQFVVARACLRTLLGLHLGVAPRDVAIVLGSHGKPETPSVSISRLFFNVAHSRSAIVIALVRDIKVGVDIEHIDRDTDVLEIAAHAFTPAEFAEIAAETGRDGRKRAFFKCWTRKEAVAKADGRGLSLPLESFTVPITRHAFHTPVSVHPAADEPACRYFVTDIPFGEEVAAAFALNVEECRMKLFDFPAFLWA